jgi:hypothetical protein
MQSHGLSIDTIHTPTPLLCHFTVSLSTVFNTASCATPSGSTTFTEDARIEPRTNFIRGWVREAYLTPL